MGFYSPATIVKDAQRHGLKLLPVDVTRSEWQCTLETVSGQFSALSKNDAAAKRRQNAAQRRKRGLDAENNKPGGAKEYRATHGPALRRGLRQDAAQALLQDACVLHSHPSRSHSRVPELRKDELTTLAEIAR